MYELFTKPAVRFLFGFGFACFFGMPLLLVLFGFPTSLWFIVPFVVLGVAGGIFWMRRPPEIFYKLPPEPQATGIFRTPTARFFRGFLTAALVYVPVIWLIERGQIGLSEIGPMTAVGIVCGLMAARKSSTLFWSARRLRT